jgi:hypothetical protein
MAQLETRTEALEAQLGQGEDVKVVPHPNMAPIYSEQVANLRAALTYEDSSPRPAEIMRTLIHRIELAPEGHGKGLAVSLSSGQPIAPGGTERAEGGARDACAVLHPSRFRQLPDILNQRTSAAIHPVPAERSWKGRNGSAKILLGPAPRSWTRARTASTMAGGPATCTL